MQNEFSSCGVGFIVSLHQQSSHETLKRGISALKNLEHRGGRGKDIADGDGAGIMCDIPYDFFNAPKHSYAIACIFGPKDKKRLQNCLDIFELTFSQ